MQLIVGLGNIGNKYNFTRHNFGFLLVDQIINDYQLISHLKKFDGDLYKIILNNIETLVLKPSTYMNLSGNSVLKVASFYKINPSDIIILHDDVDLNLGKIKFKIGGGNAGHNGLKSIDKAIGNNYQRLRLGIGKSNNQQLDIADYVLAKFSEQEIEIVNNVVCKASKLLPLLLDKKQEEFMNRFYQ